MRATQCPECSAPIDLPDDECWRCEVNLEAVCGSCGFSPYDFGAGVCMACGEVPRVINLVPRTTTTT